MGATNVLASTHTSSAGWLGTAEKQFVVFSTHNGGTWILQQLAPDGDWVDVGPTGFGAATGRTEFQPVAGDVFRLHGGTTGAIAWVTNKYGEGVAIITNAA